MELYSILVYYKVRFAASQTKLNKVGIGIASQVAERQEVKQYWKHFKLGWRHSLVPSPSLSTPVTKLRQQLLKARKSRYQAFLVCPILLDPSILSQISRPGM